MPKIGLDKVRKIIQEELVNLHEGESHESAAKIMNSAAKLLSAIEVFKENVSEKARAEVADLEKVEQVLQRIIASPMQYVDATKPPTKKISFKPQKTNIV